MLTALTLAGATGLAALRADPRRAVIALDYDGTLAPIVTDPTAALPAPGAVAALRALAPQVGTLALVTGRPADVVVALAGLQHVPGLQVLGQYGAQRWSAGTLTGAAPLAGVAKALAALSGLLGPEGAALEDKGLSLVVHTRTARDPYGALARLEAPVRTVAEQFGLEVHPGRLVLELRPPGFDKGGALRSLCVTGPAGESCGAPSAVLFAGDDVGDLPAYDTVERLRAAGVPGLLVCSGSDEGPAALRARADVVVDGPPGVVALLRQLLPG